MALRTLHIGVGGRGVWPVKLFPKRDDLAVVGLCDIKADALEKAREATGLGEAACYTDWRRALDEVECDAVVVITPPQLHHEMCLAAVRAGKHVLVEKPFTMDLAEAVEVVRAAEASGVKLSVGQQARYARGNLAAVDLIRSGEVGRPQAAIMTRLSKRPGVHHSGEQRHSYAWERGVHDYDTAWSLFDAEPRRVSAVCFNPTWSPYAHGAGMYSVVEYEGGGVCTFTCSFMSHRSDNSMVVECEGGSISVDGSSATLIPADGGEPRVLDPGERVGAEEQVTNDFLAWLAGGPEPVNGMHNNLWILAMVEATGVASDEHRTVDLPAYLAEHLGG
ncbi:MAG: Gfo/Idh/MocA family oxidoreductase [Armatimonadetes bacterium]|nr:Gfo/Idh/MocA family oxidoreductase [Armatimonadota bacterium]